MKSEIFNFVMFKFNNENEKQINLKGKSISTKKNEEIELKKKEKLSFSVFLDGKSEKTVNLERILGIGGEGIVLRRGRHRVGPPGPAILETLFSKPENFEPGDLSPGF